MSPDAKIAMASATLFVSMVGGTVAYKAWIAPTLQLRELGSVFTVTAAEPTPPQWHGAVPSSTTSTNSASPGRQQTSASVAPTATRPTPTSIDVVENRDDRPGTSKPSAKDPVPHAIPPAIASIPERSNRSAGGSSSGNLVPELTKSAAGKVAAIKSATTRWLTKLGNLSVATKDVGAGTTAQKSDSVENMANTPAKIAPATFEAAATAMPKSPPLISQPPSMNEPNDPLVPLPPAPTVSGVDTKAAGAQGKVQARTVGSVEDVTVALPGARDESTGGVASPTTLIPAPTSPDVTLGRPKPLSEPPNEISGTVQRSTASKPLPSSAPPPRSVYTAVPVNPSAGADNKIVSGRPQPRVIAQARPISRNAESDAATAAKSPDVSPSTTSVVRVESRAAKPSAGSDAQSAIAPADRFQVVTRKDPTIDSVAAASVNVVSYDLESYVVLTGDTMESISESMYGTKAYASALARYNRVTVGVAVLLRPGERVRVPPREILEQDYASLVKRPREQFQVVTTPVSGRVQEPRASTTQSGATKEGPKSPLDASDAREPTSKPTGRSDNSASATYIVKQPETLWAIAKKTLGDGRRWREIYRLNSDRLENEYTVPVGTTLVLPESSPPQP